LINDDGEMYEEMGSVVIGDYCQIQVTKDEDTIYYLKIEEKYQTNGQRVIS